MLKILYIQTSVNINSSVGIKVLSQMQSMHKAGNAVNGLFVSTVPAPSAISSHISWHQISTFKNKFFSQLRYKLAMAKTVYKLVKPIHASYDIIYLRYFQSSFYVFLLGLVLKKKLVIEVQTIGTEEIRATRKQLKNKKLADRILSYFQYVFFPFVHEMFYRPLLFSKIKAVVAPTVEIANAYKKYNRPCLVLANGIKVEKSSCIEPKKMENPLKALFLKGSSTELDYDGIDRIIDSIIHHKFETKIQLAIYGDCTDEQIEKWSKHSFVTVHQSVKNQQLYDAINKAHFGFCTMAAYKKQLTELSALKLRQYYASGLPFVYCPIDTDLEKTPQLKQYAVAVPNNDSVINLPCIFEQLQSILNTPNYPQNMRKLAFEFLDWDIKVQQLINEIKTI